MDKDYDCQVTVWPSKYKIKIISCLRLTLSHQQKKYIERGGDWSFAQLCMIRKQFIQNSLQHSNVKAMLMNVALFHNFFNPPPSSCFIFVLVISLSQTGSMLSFLSNRSQRHLIIIALIIINIHIKNINQWTLNG